MLDLQPGVDLQEPEVAVGVQGLNGSQAVVSGQGRHGRCFDFGKAVPVGQRRRGFLDHLLMAPLHRAFPFQDGNRALTVANDLELDVPGLGEVFLHVDGTVTERTRGQGAGGCERGGQLRLAIGLQHADTASARGGFQQHGVSDVVRGDHRGVHVRQHVAAVADRKSRGRHRRASPRLFAQPLDPLRSRANEANAGRRHGTCEIRVLRQEPVAGMQGVRIARLRRGDHLLRVQVGRRGRVAGQARRSGRLRKVGRGGVYVRIGGDALKAQIIARPDHAAGDRRTIRNENAAKHGVP